ncbi:MAG TPA: hypothetical protein VMX13_03755 [Sedimentisphaerales bacterium]|nr:hypothetical protein [Sedimentisphaerales bacterium]
MRTAKSLIVTTLLFGLVATTGSGSQSGRRVKGTLDFRIVPNITDANKPPYISRRLFDYYKQQVRQRGPLPGREQGDEFQWYEIVPGIPKPAPVAEFEGRQYALLCTLPPFAMPAEYPLLGGRVWGLTKVEATKGASGNPVVSLELDRNGTRILNDLTEVNRFAQNHLAVLVDDRVVCILKVEIRIWQDVEIGGTFTQEQADGIATSLETAMPPVEKYVFPLRHFAKGDLPPGPLVDYWKKMLESPIPQTRLAAIKDMWRARDATTAAMLLGAVADPHPAVSKEAMYMTEMNQKLGINTPAEPVLELLRSDKPLHRAYGARLTTSHHDPNKFCEAAVAATYDSDGVAREWAFEYFKKHSAPDEVKQNLMKAILEDPVWRTRVVAAETLYYLALPEAAGPLMKAIRSGTLSGPAFHALITCGGRDAIEFLAEKAKSGDPETRRCAINTIACSRWFPADRRDATLLEAVDDPVAAVRAWTYEMIGRQKVVTANAVLREKILAGQDLREEMLFFALSRIADHESGEVLFGFVEKRGRIGELALDGVANSGNASLTENLLRLIENESDVKWKERLGRAACQILEKNPNLAIDDPLQSEQMKIVIKEESRNRASGKITLYQGNLAVADVNFLEHGERWLLRCIDGRWTVLVRFGTWIS